MSGLPEDFAVHLASGLTTVARCWRIARRDGGVLGFTDHDNDLHFEDMVFAAGSGLTALALEQATGLSVDNTEAMGALSAASLKAADIDAGRYDGAEVTLWRVNWADVAQRQILFHGHIGDISRRAGAFHAELRGLTDLLGQPMGRSFQKPCGAVLGDQACGFDLDTDGYVLDRAAEENDGNLIFDFALPFDFAPGWFQRGALEVLSGAAAGLRGTIKDDGLWNGRRRITLWAPIKAAVAPGDLLRLTAGCDKRFATCRDKFANLINFQGFPDIPGSGWIVTPPRQDGGNTGGSLRA
ncbi:DUF2163 domain-containing protein [Cognatishimia sp. SS12]|uniref:DUF2163 domain-containing protein n=1 Tax=Cognatishimia sp. SS12 TaxID=2979465 RepID=UPI00232E3B17|nr:DUF2163 domain-containing protein [Cognatishimia sp. SS12]MDC0737525.1 DUF2163 domain-containing protein [Cognatishimia sp. SS12]